MIWHGFGPGQLMLSWTMQRCCSGHSCPRAIWPGLHYVWFLPQSSNTIPEVSGVSNACAPQGTDCSMYSCGVHQTFLESELLRKWALCVCFTAQGWRLWEDFLPSQFAPRKTRQKWESCKERPFPLVVVATRRGEGICNWMWSYDRCRAWGWVALGW